MKIHKVIKKIYRKPKILPTRIIPIIMIIILQKNSHQKLQFNTNL